MRTVLYHTTQQKVLSWHKPQYLVNGKPGYLPAHIVELQVNDDPGDPPAYDQDTQKISTYYAADILAGTYSKQWKITAKTLEEIEFDQKVQVWPAREWNKRIVISLAALYSNASLKEFTTELTLWWTLNGFRQEIRDGYAYFYCNLILPEHQAIVDAFSAVISIEDSIW